MDNPSQPPRDPTANALVAAAERHSQAEGAKPRLVSWQMAYIRDAEGTAVGMYRMNTGYTLAAIQDFAPVAVSHYRYKTEALNAWPHFLRAARPRFDGPPQ